MRKFLIVLMLVLTFNITLLCNNLELLRAEDLVNSQGVTTTATIVTSTGSLRILGLASPYANVYFLEFGSVIGTDQADATSVFDKTLNGLEPGIHTISIYATDTETRNTLTITFSINITSNTTIMVSGIILPPTFNLSANKVKRSAPLTASGKTFNNAELRVFINGSGDNTSIDETTDSSGNWDTNVNPKLHLGNKQTYSIALDGTGGMSELSQELGYEVLLTADINNDDRVNLFDFSILMYNYGVGNPPNVLADINDNSIADLVDFSVMMYYWSGD